MESPTLTESRSAVESSSLPVILSVDWWSRGETEREEGVPEEGQSLGRAIWDLEEI